MTILERIIGVTPKVEKMVENRLMWFGHVERRRVDYVVRRVVKQLDVEENLEKLK